MNSNYFFSILYSLIIFFYSSKAFSQDTAPNLNATEPEIEKSINIDKESNKNTLSLSKESIKKSIEEILKKTPLKSLMYNQEQYDKIEKAVDAMKNEQPLVIEGQENENKDNNKEESSKKEVKVEDNIKSYVYLSSIIYLSDNNWSIWVNDKKFTTNTNSTDKELYFKKVTPEYVNILWKLSLSKWKVLSGKKSESLAPKINDQNQVEIEFTLRANQTFILSQNKVANGRITVSPKPSNPNNPISKIN